MQKNAPMISAECSATAAMIRGSNPQQDLADERGVSTQPHDCGFVSMNPIPPLETHISISQQDIGSL
jgi:hypothetical protein